MAMPWVAIAQMGMSLLSGFQNSKLEAAQYKSQRILDKAEVEASNKIREANNELGNAQASLSNWMRSVSNKRTIEAAGEQYNALGENLGRMWAQSATGSLQRRIQASEQMGAIQASAAAAGVGGSTVDMINGSLKLRNAMLNMEIEKQEGQATYDQLMQRAGVMDNGYDQWDHSYDASTSDFMSKQMPIRVDPGSSSASWKSVFLETTFGAAGNLFNKSGDTAGPLSLLGKLGMNGQSAGQAGGFMGGLFGGGGGGAAPQGGQGLQASQARSYTTTPAGYTFQGLRL